VKKRLQTILAHAGVASRRRAAELIESGSVKVDGLTVMEKGLRLDPEEHHILVDGRPLRKEKKYYFLLNKPKGVISTVRDTHGRKKVTDLFKDVDARLYPIGRLDRNTTGIILITNDGDLAHRLSHPSFSVDKEYRVTVKGAIAPEKIRVLSKGIEIEGKKTSPCSVGILRKTDEKTVLSVKIHEGRKRQIRRMFESVGKRVTELDRVGYAGLGLGRLERGDYRPLTKKEVDKLKRL